MTFSISGSAWDKWQVDRKLWESQHIIFIYAYQLKTLSKRDEVKQYVVCVLVYKVIKIATTNLMRKVVRRY